MKMKKICTLLIVCISSTVFCQSDELIVPFFNNGKWGFMNKAKEIIVCPKYEEAYPSFSNRLRIKINGKYGYIDQTGKITIKPKYEVAEDFKHGIAKVEHKGKVTYINYDGKKNKQSIALCGTHKNCHHPKLSSKIKIIEEDQKLGIIHDRIIRTNNKTSYTPDTIQPMFDAIFPITHQLMGLKMDSLIAFSHEGSYLTGKDYILENLDFVYQAIKQFDCDLCSDGKNEYIGIKKDNLWGFMRIYIEPIEHIIPKYFSINSLVEGFALVEFEIGKFGYIDSKGTEYFIR